MKIKKDIIVFGIVIAILIGISLSVQTGNNVYALDDNRSAKGLSESISDNSGETPESLVPKSSSFSGENLDILNAMFDAKLAEYNTHGYFPEIYEASLQATYYGLYVLDALGKLDDIDQAAITAYVMSHYNASSGKFLDRYALRYLDTDFSIAQFPYASLLEVNCYAILSLEILGNVDLIDAQKSINFIWDCYNNDTSGFIGQTYTATLPEKFKISTMDNTYYAIMTLDLLMPNWDGYSDQKGDLTNYINGLQSTSPWEWKKGGFSNDEDIYFLSLEMFEPNLLSCYYSVKSLDIFGLAGTIRTEDFREYLKGIYNDADYNFQMNYDYTFLKEQDIVATALGLQLSDYLTPPFLNAENRTGAINFLLNSRNSLGNWDSSSQIAYHELMDTFQVIRAFYESGEISQLSTGVKDEIASAVANYIHYHGFSLLSEDYASVEQLYSVVNSFALYDRIADLDIPGIYDAIKDTIYCNEYFEYYFFTGSTNMDPQLLQFRSYPIEYYRLGYSNYLKELNELRSHKYAYMALDALNKIFKLDDLDYYLQNSVIPSSLIEILDDIVSTQFLNDTLENYGAFLPSVSIANLQSYDQQNKRIYFENTYYAIKALKLLAEYLNLGGVKDLNFDKDALHTYIESYNRQVDLSTTFYFNPHSFNDVETILQNTYYMIYVLNEIDYLYTLDATEIQKIKNFVEQSVDYTNIKNIYYSYKVSEILNLNVTFDVDLTQELVKLIYSEQLNEFFLATDNETIAQEVFLWVAEMAKNDEIRVNGDCPPSVALGDYLRINATLCNIILESFGASTLVKFESDQLGTIDLVKQPDGSYTTVDGVSNYISADPNNYPTIDGALCVYEGAQKLHELPVSIQTTYELDVNPQVSKDSDQITIVISVSLVTDVGSQPLFNGRVFADAYKNDGFLRTIEFSYQEIPQEERTEFSYTYISTDPGDYTFEVYLDDTFQQDPYQILIESFSHESDDLEGSNDPEGDDDGTKDSEGTKSKVKSENNDSTLVNALPLIISFIAIPSGVIGLSTKLLRKAKIKSKIKE